MESYKILSNSPAVTFNFGKRVGGRLQPGSILALMGELGCGKTLFTRGICAGLDVPLRQVNSPTFVLANEYRGRLPVFHMDLYRIGGIAEVFEIGMLDYLSRAESGVIIVEWAEKVLSLLPDNYLKVEFEVLSASRRRLELAEFGERFEGLFRELCRK